MSAGRLRSGASAPLGATVRDGGVNFSVFSKDAYLVELLLFDDASAAKPVKVIPLKADKHRSYHYWHVFMPDLRPSQVYAYRAHGPFAPERGFRFDGEKVLVDPYGLAVAVPDRYDRWAAARPGDNAATSLKSVVADPDRYDWRGDLPLSRPFAETVIYELHVAGFTRHPSSGVPSAMRGTYAGLIQKIPYLKDPGRHRYGAIACLSVRPSGRSSRPRELLGIPARFILRAASRLQFAEGPARSPR